MKRYLRDMTRDEILDRLKSGIKIENGAGAYIEFVDGVLCATNNNSYDIINYQLDLSNTKDWYFQMPLKTVEVVVGQFYMTRDGEKAYVFNKNEDGDFSVAIEGGIVYNILPTGYYSEERESGRDLVSLCLGNCTVNVTECEQRSNPKKAVNQAVEDSVIDAYKSGLTQKEIAEMLDIPQTRVFRLLSSKNIKSPRMDLFRDKVKKLVEDGLTYREIAASVGKTYSYIFKVVSSNPDLYALYQHKRG